jgi:hypothetical protein
MCGLAKSAELRLQGVGIHYRRLVEEDAEDRMDASRRRSAPDPSVCVLPEYIPKFVDVRYTLVGSSTSMCQDRLRTSEISKGGCYLTGPHFVNPKYQQLQYNMNMVRCSSAHSSNLIDKLGTCGGAVPSLPGFVPATCITNMSSKVLQ